MKRNTLAVRRMLGWLLLAACLVLAGAAVLNGYHPVARTGYALSGRKAEIKPVPVQQGSISVNLADTDTLDELPGVGPVTAQAIVDERALHGPFFYPEDLMQVRGIGEKKLSGMRELLDMKEE